MFSLKVAIGAVVGIVIFSTVLYPVVVNYDSEPSTLDVIIIDGQSNAEYSSSINRCNKALIDLPVPNQALLYYGSEHAANSYPSSDSNQIYSMNREGYWQIGGLEPYLAYTYAERSGHDVLTINVARGAQSIAWLAPPGAGGEYAKNVIDSALAQVQGYRSVNMVGWVMLQGEQDKNMPVETYKGHFMELSEYFTSIGADNCYIASTREYYGGNACIAQEELAQASPNIHISTHISDTFTESNGYLVSGDPIHYSQKGRNLIAEELGAAIQVSPGREAFNLIQVVPIIVLVAMIASIMTIAIRARPS